MADIDLIKRNLTKMVEQGAPEADLNAYLSTEGFKSADEWRAASAPGGKTKPVAAAMAVGSPPIGEAPSIGPGPRTSAMPDQPDPQSWGDVGRRAVANFLPSAGKAAGNIYNALSHPLDTAAGVVNLGVGALENLPQPRQTEERKNAIAARNPGMVAGRNEAKAGAAGVGDYFSNRFGGLENIKETIASDPAGALLDASIVSPTAGAALPGKLGAVVRSVDPLTAGGNALRLGVSKVAEPIVASTLGRTTGAGQRSIRDAGGAGRELGLGIGKDEQTIANANALIENRRGAPVENVVGRAKGALDEIRQDAGKEYRSGMVDLSKDRTILDFAPIDAALGKASEVASFKGVKLNPSAAETNSQIATVVNDWKTLNPKSDLFKDVPSAELTAENFHTPEGLDALKRVVGDIRDSTDYGTPARAAADRVYRAVWNEINAQAPAYGKIMGGYETAKGKVNEASKTFSLGERATGDTAARKLLSATRDNVQTNNGGRANLLDMLAEKDPTLPYAVAGQALNALQPRGIVANAGAIAGASAIAPAVMSNPLSALSLVAFSPRIVGNSVYYGGRLIGAVDDVAAFLHITPQNLRLLEQGGFQSGRADDVRQRAMSLRQSNALAAP